MDQSALLLVNRISQRLTPLREGVSWFSKLPAPDQLSALRALGVLCGQAGASHADLDAAAAWSAHSPRSGAFKYMRDGTLRDRVAKANKVPTVLWTGLFELLVGLLAVSDARRRQRDCSAGCSHWWHQISS